MRYLPELMEGLEQAAPLVIIFLRKLEAASSDGFLMWTDVNWFREMFESCSGRLHYFTRGADRNAAETIHRRPGIGKHVFPLCSSCELYKNMSLSCQVDTLFPSDRFLRLFCHPGDGIRIADAVAAAKLRENPPKAVVLAVGPEGGWVDYEVNLFQQHGFVQVTLGRRILTTDIAIVSLASLTLDALAASENATKMPLWTRGAALLSRLLPCI